MDGNLIVNARVDPPFRHREGRLGLAVSLLERHHDRLPPVFDHHNDRPAIGQLIKRVRAVVHLRFRAGL